MLNSIVCAGNLRIESSLLAEKCSFCFTMSRLLKKLLTPLYPRGYEILNKPYQTFMSIPTGEINLIDQETLRH